MKHKRARAQSLVEFALLLPILLAVIFGLIDAALIFQGYLTVAHAAREGARYAVVYQPNQGECLEGDTTYPNCPYGGAPDPTETDNEYYNRRSLIIKREAIAAAKGLRTTTICSDANSNSCVASHNDEPGMLGVRIWGFQAFDEAEQSDMPGLRGLPIRVQVVHNVPLVVFSTFLPNAHMQVRSAATLINEGVQVGFGNQPPPTFAPMPPPAPPGTAVPTLTPEPTATPGPTPTNTPIPEYNITLNFVTALNTLPDEREHEVIARVTEYGNNVAGAEVTFATDFGSFHYSGVDPSPVVAATNAGGLAYAMLYANLPDISNITAWLDYNGDGNVDPGEPSATAVKTWEAVGPYLVISDHNPEPAAWINSAVMDHDPTFAPFSLWWCPTWTTSTQTIEQLAFPVTVDTDWDNAEVPVQVPVNVSGRYRIESHTGDGGSNACGQSSTLQAYSSDIEILAVPPDLVISNVQIISDTGILPGVPVMIQVEVLNQAPVAMTGAPVDVDMYMDIDIEPGPMQLGVDKQWIDNLGPLESTLVTMTTTVYDRTPHTLWFQVDTTNYVDEGETGGEENNTDGPYLLSAECTVDSTPYGDDFNDQSIDGKWTRSSIPSSVSASATENSSGQLQIQGCGSSTWGNDDNMYYVHQSIPGDFDARLRIVATSTRNEWSKVGLMVRNSTNANSRYVMLALTRDHGLQLAYRPTDGGSAARAANDTGSSSTPVWARITRVGDTFTYYSSTATNPDDDDWTYRATITVDMADTALVGIGHAAYTTSYCNYSSRRSFVDEFVICQGDEAGGPSGTGMPPGLTQCTELLSATGFEGNPETVAAYWTAGDANNLVGAYQRTSAQFRQGSFSLRMHASDGFIPCESSGLQPYVYQEVQIPTEIYTFSTLTVEGYYFVDRSTLECSVGSTSDGDDTLNLNLYDGSTPQLAPQAIIDGSFYSPSTSPGTWYEVVTELTDAMADPTVYAGQTLRLQWNGYNDSDIHGTFFYLDDLSAELCTSWPIPPEEPGTASIGGVVKTYGQNNIPIILSGADVWAYTQGGEVLQTSSIHDGTYHFYNVPAGNYIIYAEAWMGGQLRTAATQATVATDERNYDVNLLLQ